jgi:hypothetical protein
MIIFIFVDLSQIALGPAERATQAQFSTLTR